MRSLTCLEPIIYIFCRYSAREPASVSCDDEQDDQSHSAGPHTGNLRYPKRLTQLKSRERTRGEMKVNGPGR